MCCWLHQGAAEACINPSARVSAAGLHPGLALYLCFRDLDLDLGPDLGPHPCLQSGSCPGILAIGLRPAPGGAVTGRRPALQSGVTGLLPALQSAVTGPRLALQSAATVGPAHTPASCGCRRVKDASSFGNVGNELVYEHFAIRSTKKYQTYFLQTQFQVPHRCGTPN